MLSEPEIFALPAIGITADALAELPEHSCLYFVTNGPTLLYIGRTKNLRRRWVRHHKRKRCLAVQAALRWIIAPDDGLPATEEALIKALCPEWNAQTEFAFGRGKRASKRKRRNTEPLIEPFPDDELGRLRRALGMNRRQLATILGCNRASLAKWEAGACPRYIILAALAIYHRLDDSP